MNDPAIVEKAAKARYESGARRAGTGETWEMSQPLIREWETEGMEAALLAVADDLRAEALRKAAGDDELWKLTEGEQRLLDANTPYYEGVAYGFRIARSLLKDHADQIARAARAETETFCLDHHPVQHRDAKEPWCKLCGLNASGKPPRGGVGRKP